MVHTSNSPEGVLYYKGPPWSATVYTFFALGYGFDLGPSTNDLQAVGWHYFLTHPGQTTLTFLGFAAVTIITIRGLLVIRHDKFLFALLLGGMAIFLLGPTRDFPFELLSMRSY